MKIKVLVVDDSGFFRRRVTDIISTDARLEVVGTADNGADAITQAEALKPDVITMDYEMPVMDGVTAVENIMATNPTPILMFSSLTFEGARVTLNALDAGAVDFLSKNFDAIANNDANMRKTLIKKIIEVANSNKNDAPAPIEPVKTVASRNHGKPELVMIGTSTGGPAALKTIFKAIDKPLTAPVIIVQHMPGSFTKAFAERLDKSCASLSVVEAQDGDRLQSGTVYVAPGGKQLIVDQRNGGTIHIRESDERMSYRPSVDLAFASAAKHFNNKTLAIVLTGMGEDGKEGVSLLANSGCDIWVQDEETSVINGMPKAASSTGHVNEILALDAFAEKIMNAVS